MKTAKLSLDFSDRPEIVDAIRLHAAQASLSQKAVVLAALEAYLSNQKENRRLLEAAMPTFDEWDNAEDAVYDDL